MLQNQKRKNKKKKERETKREQRVDYEGNAPWPCKKLQRFFVKLNKSVKLLRSERQAQVLETMFGLLALK